MSINLDINLFICMFVDMSDKLTPRRARIKSPNRVLLKKEKVLKSIEEGNYELVKINARVSPSMFIELIERGELMGIDCETTLIKIAIKRWLNQ